MASEAIAGIDSGLAQADFETIFAAQYGRVARAIDRVIRDPARAEELAVDVFLRWSRKGVVNGPYPEGWLYRTAVRIGLDELRRRTRRRRYEALAGYFGAAAVIFAVRTPEELRSAEEE